MSDTKSYTSSHMVRQGGDEIVTKHESGGQARSGPTPTGHTAVNYWFAKMNSAAFSAMIMVGAFVLPVVTVGMTDASITRTPPIP
jgi:hypothetical protein